MVRPGDPPHVPVMAGAVLEWLDIRPQGVYVDCTAGAGGHAARIAGQLRGGRLIAIDRDPAAVALCRERLVQFEGVQVLHGNYGHLEELVTAAGAARVDGVLIDAGVSSMQIDTPERGFSFQEDGPLDMRMDSSLPGGAREYLGSITRDALAHDLRRYADVGPAKRIADTLLARRDAARLCTTADLAQAIRDALDFVRGEPDEIRTVFQAIRIAVNDEFRWLERGLNQAIDILNTGGRLVVIAFHSGEDRIVKETIRGAARIQRVLHPDGRLKEALPPRLRVLTPKPVGPSPDEVLMNPRAKSARLRAGEKL